MMDALRRMKPPPASRTSWRWSRSTGPARWRTFPKYCEVKNGLSARDRLHPLIDDILDETQGIIVYQEQGDGDRQEDGGLLPGGADLLRRAMGKKIQAEMDAQRPIFLEGAARQDVPERKALEVWNLLDKFANYGFNKSHAAAYAVVSYQTAWLKANHPVEFMAGIANSDLHLTDKLAVYAEECRKPKERGGLGLEMVPPCVNRSDARFTVRDGKLVYALGALKNVGVDAMELLVAGRGGTPFATLFDVARRVELKRVGKRCLEMLAAAGAFDQLDPNRARVLAGLDPLMRYSAAIHEQRASAQVSLFGEAGEDLREPRLPDAEPWQPAEMLAEEFAAIGFYLSGHPLDDDMPALRRQDVRVLGDVQEITRNGPAVVKLAGIVTARQERRSARGNRFAFLQCSDPSGAWEAMVFSELLEAKRDLLEPGSRVILQVEAQQEADQLKLLARAVTPVDEAVAKTQTTADRASRLPGDAGRAVGPVRPAGAPEDRAGARARPHAPVPAGRRPPRRGGGGPAGALAGVVPGQGRAAVPAGRGDGGGGVRAARRAPRTPSCRPPPPGARGFSHAGRAPDRQGWVRGQAGAGAVATVARSGTAVRG